MNKKIKSFAAALLGITLLPVKVYADGPPKLLTHKPDDIIAAILGGICVFTECVGILMVILGVGDIGINFIKKDGEIKARDIMFIVVGVIMISIRFVLAEMGVISST